jgi:hypothetical protein
MNNRKTLVTLGSLLVFLILLPSARAAKYDQATKLACSRQVQIPGRMLPERTYWFVLADSLGSRNIVEIFNSDRKIPNPTYTGPACGFDNCCEVALRRRVSIRALSC